MTGANALPLHVIYASGAVIVSRREYSCWQAVEADYPGFQTSLGPWGKDEVVAYLAEEHPELSATARQRISSWLAGTDEALVVMP